MAVQVRASQIRHQLLPAVVVDLSDGIDADEASLLAVASNPALRVERAARGITIAQLVAAGVLPNPQITAGFDRPARRATGVVTGTTIGAAVDLLGFLTRPAEIEAARQDVRAIDLALAWKEWQVAQATRLQSYRLTVLDRALTLSDDQAREMATIVATLEDAVRLQLVTRVELGAAELAYRSAVESRLTLTLERDTLRAGLAQLLGVDRASLPTLRRSAIPFDDDTALAKAADVPSHEELMHEIGARRLDLQGLRMGYLSQEARVRASILRQFPAVSIGLNRTRDTGNLLTFGGVATMLFPLLDRNRGEIAVARATRAQLAAEYDARVSTTRTTVDQLRTAFAVTAQRLQNLRAAIAGQQLTVDLYGRAIQSGNADVLTYYQARSDLMNRRLLAVASLGDLISLAIALETEAGRRFLVPGA
jgi:outer membrane protein TolC